ncbi:hypothetical protein AB1Y20_014316 [Prymnesium parvum]|uniref:Nucleotide-diphospho-sugar transferase domain-containing protein n=1 Tax=Prymnesium parvum TaxID=97485 RepID=A0AB34IFF4_PRYPA
MVSPWSRPLRANLLWCAAGILLGYYFAGPALEALLRPSLAPVRIHYPILQLRTPRNASAAPPAELLATAFEPLARRFAWEAAGGGGGRRRFPLLRVEGGGGEGEEGGGEAAYDLDEAEGLRRAVREVGVGGEVVLFTSDWSGARAAVNLALQLRELEIRQHLVLADAKATCERLHATWPWLACGWSRGLDGFEKRYASSQSAAQLKLWQLWSAKWLVMARLVELRVNVLGLDTDMMLLANPYEELHSPLLAPFTMVLPPEGSRVNLGFLYVRGKSAQPFGGAVSVLWDVVRRLRLFLEDYTLTNAKGRASMMGLWDQGLFTDALVSAMRAEHVYPYTYLQAAPRTRLWADIGWPPASLSEANISKLHAVPWRRRFDHFRPANRMPPEGHPQRLQWEREKQVFEWHSLTPLPPLAALRRGRAAINSPGFLDPSALSPNASRLELAAATPDWLYCLVGRWAITAGYPSLRPPLCSVLHLVETRAAFGVPSASKANRPYAMAAFGHFHLAARTPPPRRVLRLAPLVWRRVAAHASLRPLLAALQLLAVAAAVSGRAPLVPSVPCGSAWIERHPMSLAGVADDYILQLRRRDGTGELQCHLAMGGTKCTLPTVLPAWYSDAILPASAFPSATRADHPTAAAPPEDAAATPLRASLSTSAYNATPPSALPAGCASSKRIHLHRLVAALRAAPPHARLVELSLDGPLPRCPARLDTSPLSPEEMARLRALRRACGGFFAEPTADGPHRRRLRRKAARGA